AGTGAGRAFRRTARRDAGSVCARAVCTGAQAVVFPVAAKAAPTNENGAWGRRLALTGHQPEFQRFIEARAAALRGRGVRVELMR
ncbi:MAG: hypothetical protein ABI831_06940, partial [Betaproteobacteria bacterium]